MAQQQQDLAKMRPQVYKDPRPKEYFDRFHERARNRPPDWMYELVRITVSFYTWIAFRARSIGSDQVPAGGNVILAPNHFSFMDHFFLAAFVRRKVRFMAKSQLFTPPLQFIYTHGGVFPVRRGYADEEAFITAEKILEDGGTVAMYCEGGRSRTGQVGEQAKRGIGKLALETGAPIVPVAIFGSQRVRNWKRLQFPKVTIQYGEPFRYERIENPTRHQQQQVADEILAEIRELYAALEQLGRRGVIQRLREQRRGARRTAPAQP